MRGLDNPLMHVVGPETAEVIGQILGPFLRSNIGKNDMAVVNGLLASAAILLATHCAKTGEDYRELVYRARELYDLGAEIAGEAFVRRK